MDDVIYRKDVLNLIPQDISDFEEGSCLAYDVGRLPSAQQWIPCSERLPEEPGRYMVTDKEGNVRFGMYSTKIPMWWGGANQPTAWRPMPEPYKEVME